MQVLGQQQLPHWNRTFTAGRVEVNPAMLWMIFAILLILWLLGLGFHVAGSLIHVLLVIAVLLLIVDLVKAD
jgi:hypothetical protein